MAARPSSARRTVGVAFGGTSVEHDVSIISALQLMAVLSERHDVVPLYLGSDGRWWTGEALQSVSAFAQQPPSSATPIELRIGAPVPWVSPSRSRMRGERPLPVDVVINAIHGTSGEDGVLLAALQLAGLPYVGGGVTASAVAMDKYLAKLVVADAGVDVLPGLRIERHDWETDRAGTLQRAITAFPGAVIVKPSTLGSSIGVTKCDDPAAIQDAIDLALELDRQAILEPFATGAIELNVAVVGRPGGELVVSEVERPLGSADGLTFEDKYIANASGGKGGKSGKTATKHAAATHDGAKGGGPGTTDRIIPADVSAELRERIQQTALQAHRALRLAGVTRYDFFVLDDGARIVLNEPNTVPGSFANYLFAAVGMAFPELAERLLEIADGEFREEQSTSRQFTSSLLRLHIDR
jgi:D-alanine-D-alanine ligase